MQQQKNDSNSKVKRLLFTVVIGVTLVFCAYKFFWTQNVERVGIYSKGLVVKSDATKGGILITVQFYYKNSRYESTVGSDLGKGAIGRQYFIQFKPKDPKAIVFHRDRPVPDCLIDVEAPKEGWDKIPSCP